MYKAAAVAGSSLKQRSGLVVGQRLLVAVHLVLLAATLMPLALVDIPALVDYPNHLARMHIIAELGRSPELQKVYAVQLLALPNIAMDLLVPALAKFTGTIVAGKLFIASVLLLLALSTVALQWVVQGRLGISSLAVHLVAFNLVFFYGFLNYLLGIGAAILLLAVWIGLQHRSWQLRLVAGATGALVIFFCHPIAFACYGLLVIGYELSHWLYSNRRDGRQLFGRCAVSGLQFLPTLLLLLMIQSPMGGPELDIQYLAGVKLMSLFVPTLFSLGPADISLTLALLAAAAIFLFRAELRFGSALILCAAGLAVAVIATPTWLSGNWGNDFRLMVPLTMVLIAACRLEPRDSRILMAVAAAVLVIFTVRLVIIASNWVEYDALYNEVAIAAAELEPGARVLPVITNVDHILDIAPTASRSLFNHTPALLLLHSSAFVPTLFTAQGRQPLSVTAAFSEIDIPHGAPLPLPVLKLALDPKSAAEIVKRSTKGNFFHHRFAGWPAKFNYVFMIDFGQQQNPLPSILGRVVSGSYFTLYRIKSDGENEI